MIQYDMVFCIIGIYLFFYMVENIKNEHTKIMTLATGLMFIMFILYVMEIQVWV